jgi:predicted AAA+ superfamily ATPase
MERLILQKLEAWKASKQRKPLIIRGARQVGKSYTVMQFGQQYVNGRIHLVNFEKHPEWLGVFDLNLDPVRIISELEVILNTKISRENDLLFLDEIQMAPKAIMALRYFYEEMPELHVIAAGSLLEFALQEISFPVGRVSIMTMHPMNFYEFLRATGKDKLAEIIVAKPEKQADLIHATLLDNLRQYLFVGGMPACVEAWRNRTSLVEVFEIQQDLLYTFQQDFSKYGRFVDKNSLNFALNAVARNIGHPIKYTQISDNFSGPVNKKALELLSLARLITKVPASTAAALPLGAYSKEHKFKMLMVDLGLLRCLNQLPANIEYLKSDLMSVYNGAMAEQFAGQEFLSSGNENLYFWSREAKSSSAEVDYLFTCGNQIYPAEIKSGAAGKLRSLHLLLKTYAHLDTGYVLSTAPFGELPDQKLTFLPIYYAFWLAQERTSSG